MPRSWGRNVSSKFKKQQETRMSRAERVGPEWGQVDSALAMGKSGGARQRPGSFWK